MDEICVKCPYHMDDKGKPHKKYDCFHGTCPKRKRFFEMGVRHIKADSKKQED
jgi:hypothetical protein